MIDHEIFGAAWKRLCVRFGRKVDSEEAADYHEYLSEQLGTEDFLAACRTLWATATFFPRPADFVLVGAADDWSRVLGAVEKYTPPQAEWVQPWRSLSPRARAACDQIGGISAMRAIYERDVLRLRTAWEKAYEQEVGRDALKLSAGDVRLLRPV
jgi:hypothetical protein